MIKEYIIQQTLGKGSYGTVYKVQKKNTNEIYVIKQIPINCLSQKEISEVRQEAKILSSINSDFVVKYYDSFEENNKINIVMEYCDEGDLNNFIIKKRKDNKLLEESLIWNLFIKITIGLAHIHKMKILHRDLKTMNIFLKNGFQVKIGDLGVAKVLLKNSFAKTLIGTPYYLSPEICQEKPYNDKSDVWALGCILYELCTFKHPFDAKSQGALILKIMNNTPESINNNYSNELKNLVSLLLEKDFEKRPSCGDILNLDFVIDKLKNIGLINYLKEFIQPKIIIKDNNNIINKVKISTKIINRNNINNINNNFNNNNKIFVKHNLIKENSKKIENNDNSIKNKNLVKNNIQYKNNNDIKITEITFTNDSNKSDVKPTSNKNANKQFLYNNFFINNEKNKYNKKLSNVIISKKNEKMKNKEKPDIISKKIGKINPFKIVLNIPETPSKNNHIFSPKKILSNRNNEKKFNLYNNKENVFKINNNINIKKIIPKNNFFGKVNKVGNENSNKKSTSEKEDKIISNLSEKEINKKDNNYIIKYNKLVYDEKNKDKKEQYLINILQGNNINKNNNVSKEESIQNENFKEKKESTNFEIINNQSNNSSKLDDSIENQELEDSIDENFLIKQKNQSNLPIINDLENKNEKENIIVRDYDEENVKEIRESKKSNIKNSIKLNELDKKEQLNKEISALEEKIKEIKNDILNLIGEDDYKFIMDLFENNNKRQNRDDEICEEIENFSKNKFSPEKKEKFFYHYFLLLCNDSLLDKKYKEIQNLKQ